MDTPSTTLSRRFMEALHALDRDGDAAVPQMCALFAPEATIDNPALTLVHDDRRGSGGIDAFWTSYVHAMRGATTDFHAVTAGDAAIGLFWTTRRQAQVDGSPLYYDGATLLRLDGEGAIAAMRGYYDTRALETPAR